jgi:hypothetical protein
VEFIGEFFEERQRKPKEAKTAGKKDTKSKGCPCDRTEKSKEKSSGKPGEEPPSWEVVQRSLVFLKEAALLKKAFKNGQGRSMNESLSRIRSGVDVSHE